MKLRLASVAACLLLVALPTVSRAAAETVPVVTRSSGVTTITQLDASAPLLHVVYVVRAGLDRQSLSQNGLAALTAQTILNTPENGVPLRDAIAAAGGSISFTVDPSDVRFAIEALPQDADKVLKLAQAALAKPAFDPATVRSARNRLITRIAENQQIALQVGLDMLNSTLAPSANAGCRSLDCRHRSPNLDPMTCAPFTLRTISAAEAT